MPKAAPTNPAGIVRVDASGIIRDVDRPAAALLGLMAGAVLNRGVHDRVADTAAAEALALVAAALRDGEAQRHREDGRRLRARAAFGATSTSVLIEDVTATWRVSQRLRLRDALVAVGRPHRQPMAMLSGLLAQLRRCADLAVGELWIQDTVDGAPRLVCVDHDEDAQLVPFIDATRRTVLGPGSLPLRALASRAPLLVDDVTVEPEFRRREAAQTAGLVGAVHLPLRVDHGFAAVVGFLGVGRPGDADNLALLAELHPALLAVVEAHHAGHSLERLFTMTREMLSIAATDGYLRRVNPAFAAALGVDELQVTSRPWATLVHPEDRSALGAVLGDLAAGAPRRSFTHRYRSTTGAERVLRFTTEASPEEGLLYSVARDVTDDLRDRVFEAGQRELLRGLVEGDSLPATVERAVMLAEVDHPAARVAVLLVDPAAQQLRLAAAPELESSFRRAIDGLPVGAAGGPYGTAAEQDAAVVTEDTRRDAWWSQHRDLVVGHGVRSCWVVPFRAERSAVHGLLALHHDAPFVPEDRDWRRIEDLAGLLGVALSWYDADARLRGSEHRFRLVAAATADIVWDYDLATRRVWWGPGFAAMFGYDYDNHELPLETSWRAHVHPEDRGMAADSLARAIERGEQRWASEYRVMHADGHTITVQDRGHIVRDETGRAVRVLGGITDITAQRELERRYLRAQRLESLGTLAAGITHDLNNVLAPIRLAADLLSAATLPDELSGLVETITESAERGSRLVGQVLSFNRGVEGARERVALADVLDALRGFIVDTLPDTVQVQRTGSVRGLVRGDRTQLEQVVMNLVVNARDALPAGGRLTLGLDEVELPAAPLDAHGQPATGTLVRLTVHDTGVGLSEAARDRIFEPFFTTKPLSGATGLGLSTSLAIVRSHGGFITVDSAAGQGTTIAVHLPRDDEGA